MGNLQAEQELMSGDSERNQEAIYIFLVYVPAKQYSLV